MNAPTVGVAGSAGVVISAGVSLWIRPATMLTCRQPPPEFKIAARRRPLWVAPAGSFMTVLVVRLGSPRVAGEGLRIGTVRRPPRGVPAARFASDNWYDVWYPNLAPSVETMKLGKGAQTDREWAAFAKRFRAEMKAPAASRSLDLLAALSRTTDFSIGCYCEDESRCHRSVLRELLATRGARFS